MIIYKVDYDKLINHSRFYKYRRKVDALAVSLQLHNSQYLMKCEACKLDHYLH